MKHLDKMDSLTANTIVLHRLRLLGYAGEPEIAGTGMTYSDLIQSGYSDAEVAQLQGGTPLVGRTTDMTIADTSSGGSGVSGLTDLFGAIGSAFQKSYQAVAGPKPGQIVQGPAGQPLVYDPATGQYRSAIAGTQTFGTSGIMLLAIAAVVVVLLVRR